MRYLLSLGGFSILAAIGAGIVLDGTTDDISGYKGWTKVNKEPVYMLPEVSKMCVQRPEYSTSNPHVTRYITVYVNEIGRAAMAKDNSTFPVGTIIVKEKFSADQGGLLSDEPEMLTVMIKRKKGFNPNCGDWEFRTASAKAEFTKNETVNHCVSCHVRKPKSDFTFRTYVGK